VALPTEKEIPRKPTKPGLTWKPGKQKEVRTRN